MSSSIIKSIDIFGNEFKLNVSGKKAHNTILGGLSTLFLLFAILVLSWYFGQDIYLKQSPKHLSHTAYKDKTPFITLNSSSFSYAFHMEDEDGNKFDNKSYYEFVF